MVSCSDLRWPKNDVRLQINRLKVIQGCSVKTVKLNIYNGVIQTPTPSPSPPAHGVSPSEVISDQLCPISARTRRNNAEGVVQHISLPMAIRVRKTPEKRKSQPITKGSNQPKQSEATVSGIPARPLSGTWTEKINESSIAIPQFSDSVVVTSDTSDVDVMHDDAEIDFGKKLSESQEEDLMHTPDINQNLSLDMTSAMLLLQQKDGEIAQLRKEKNCEIECLKLEIAQLKVETAELKRKLEAFKLDWTEDVFPVGEETEPQNYINSKIQPPVKRRLRTQSETQCELRETQKNRSKRKVVFFQQEQNADSATANVTTAENVKCISVDNLSSREIKDVNVVHRFSEFQPERDALENHSENDSGVEVDARCEHRNSTFRKLRNRKRQKSLGPSCKAYTAFRGEDGDSEIKSISSSSNISQISQRRGMKSCKYGKLCVDKSKNDGICKVSFPYPQRPGVFQYDAMETDELNYTFQPEELALLPMYGQYRIKEISPLNTKLTPKNLASDMTAKKCQERHEYHEGQEKLRKKWADSRERQIEMHENLMKRQKSSNTLLDHLTVPQCDRSFARDPEGITDVEVSNEVPVSAFGANVPYLESKNFSLEWFNAKKYKFPKL